MNFYGLMRTAMENELENEQRLWLSLSSQGSGKVFVHLSKLMSEIMENEKNLEEDAEEEMEITFPSDYEWRTKLYLKMLAKQRNQEKMEDESIPDSSVVLHDWNIVPEKNKKVPFCAPDAARLANKEFIIGPGPITWTVSDIAKAGRLLSIPPLPTEFEDEQEMRRVYTLIYDVYRYKNILNQALDDIVFFLEHPEMDTCISRVWLLLFDLYHRSFKKRTLNNEAIAQNLFPNCGLKQVENTLWLERIKLAASVARLRIKNSALRLSELLPHHLRDDKASSQTSNAPVTCWVNIKKVKNLEELAAAIERALKLKLIEESDDLGSESFKWDVHCPQFVIFHPSARTKLVQSTLVQKNKLIVQDRSFCLGPATFGKIVSDLQLSGSVIQSHVNSPRTTAYLASLLSQNDNIKKLLAFSAGNRKSEYESYFNDLGIKNIMLFSEKFIDIPPDSSSLEEVIAVFATPPNSYSAVTDPIDLVCSRGGDLTMLEILTETEDTPEGRKRVANILDEQKRTLKYAMSRPQIQFVLYETHSEIDAENSQMVEKIVDEINGCARLHHAGLQGKLRQIQAIEEKDQREREINNNEMLVAKSASVKADNSVVLSPNAVAQKARLLKEVVVPDCDVFDVPNLLDLCPNIESCMTLSKEGCYLALLQRKHVTRMDNKYMIQMAETRGLFGSETSTKKSTKPVKKKQERVPSPPIKVRKRTKEIEITRISAPTFASNQRAYVVSGTSADCAKLQDKDNKKVPQTRRWWTETTRHITNLRTSLSQQKLLSKINETSSETTALNAKRFVNNLVRKSQKVDEIVAKSFNKPSSIPVYPRLRLTRFNKIDNKIPVPIHVTMVTFPSNRFSFS